MSRDINLDVTPREVAGKEVRKLRRQGLLPGVLYGYKVEAPTPIQVEERLFERVYRQAGMSTLINVKMGDGGAAAQALIHRISRDPVTHSLMHFDLMAVNPREEMTAEVPVVLVGEAPAARAADAILMHELNAVSLRGLPADMPHVVEVDITSLEEPDQAIHVRDLSFPDSVTVLTDPDQMVVKIVHVRAEPEPEVEEPEAEAEAEEGEGGEEVEAGTEEEVS